MVPWAHLSPQPKQHLDRFVLAALTSVTDRPTDRPRYSVGNNKPHLRITQYYDVRPNNAITRSRNRKINGLFISFWQHVPS